MATPENTLSSSPKSPTIPLPSPPAPPATPPTPRSGSPRFNVFHRHFHSKSNSDSAATVHATTVVQPDTSVVAVPARTEAVRDAKRFLLSTVRDDWSFPPVQSPESAEEESREPV